MAKPKPKPNEDLADYAHDTWCRWLRYMFSKGVEESDGLKLPHKYVERWRRQMNTPYPILPEEEKYAARTESIRITRIFLGDEE